MAPTFVDLFCGIGGFRIGLEDAGFECVYANDIDYSAVATYKNNRDPDATYPVECADIREVFKHRLDSIPPHHGTLSGESPIPCLRAHQTCLPNPNLTSFIVLAAGFPCQPYSLRGKKLGDLCPKYGDLRKYVVQVVAAKRPVAAILENVEYFFHYSRTWYTDLEDDFKHIGYICCFKILLAEEFGVPQNRRRGFIVAVREDVPGVPFKFPPLPVVDPVTVRQILLPADSPDLINFRKLKNEDISVEWRKKISPPAAWKDVADNIPAGWQTTVSGILHLGQLNDPLVRAGGRVYHDLGHHPCMTASDTSAPWFLTSGSDKEGMVARKLHMRELCRIQGLPDSFGFRDISFGGMFRQLGNSVPPPMVEWIGRALLEQFRAALFDDSDDNDNEGGDEGKEKRKETTRLKNGKSRRKSGGSSRSKSHKRSKRHSKRRSKRHKHRSKRRSKKGSERNAAHKSSESSKTSSEPTSKRKISSDSDIAPPPKRQHLQNDTLTDEEAEVPLPVAQLDGHAEG